MSDEVLTERRGQVLVVTINRPQARNAVNRAVSVGIAEAMDELDSDPGLALGVLTGAGGSFSAGMDLKAFVTGELPTLPERGFGGITQAPPRKPLIAAVEGYALAGGCELALACDLVVAAESAKFGIPEVKRGLVAAAGGLMRLPRLVPPVVAMEMALTGDFMSAADAYRYGLVNRVVPEGGALDGALELAARITPNGPLAVVASKRIMRESADWSSEQMWERQGAIAEPVMRSADAVEGARAFAEKRAPVWRGE
ncbi:crotonase/enoyl-CoA hydratase family protein [Pseudonocardia acaciae]|uniref:crotonase/enoyl-CoA hydratase family protein n=1 Tax=Pseudonocardia acaciae TaxID=551276 RepID=UPI00048EB7DC|nr:crotonase/enoyl-CoA hydratase family protein [Pseudonocardia acaciae]